MDGQNPQYQTNSECGPHCVNKDGHVAHCDGCHARRCEFSRYDRSQAKPV